MKSILKVLGDAFLQKEFYGIQLTDKGVKFVFGNDKDSLKSLPAGVVYVNSVYLFYESNVYAFEYISLFKKEDHEIKADISPIKTFLRCGKRVGGTFLNLFLVLFLFCLCHSGMSAHEPNAPPSPNFQKPNGPSDGPHAPPEEYDERPNEPVDISPQEPHAPPEEYDERPNEPVDISPQEPHDPQGAPDHQYYVPGAVPDSQTEEQIHYFPPTQTPEPSSSSKKSILIAVIAILSIIFLFLGARYFLKGKNKKHTVLKAHTHETAHVYDSENSSTTPST